MQCASSMTSSPAAADRAGSTWVRNRGLLSRSGETSSRSTSPAASDRSTSDHSLWLVELIVAARMPMRRAASIWSRISASSGETSSVGPAPASRSSRVARKYTADLPQPVRWTTSARRRSTTSAPTAASWSGRSAAPGPASPVSSACARAGSVAGSTGRAAARAGSPAPGTGSPAPGAGSPAAGAGSGGGRGGSAAAASAGRGGTWPLTCGGAPLPPGVAGGPATERRRASARRRMRPDPGHGAHPGASGGPGSHSRSARVRRPRTAASARWTRSSLAVARASERAECGSACSMPKVWQQSTSRHSSSGWSRRVSWAVQSAATGGSVRPASWNSARRKPMSNRTLWATTTAPSSSLATSPATSAKAGAAATMPSVMPWISVASTGRPGARRVSYSSTTDPSGARRTMPISRARCSGHGSVPVVSRSTTAHGVTPSSTPAGAGPPSRGGASRSGRPSGVAEPAWLTPPAIPSLPSGHLDAMRSAAYGPTGTTRRRPARPVDARGATDSQLPASAAPPCLVRRGCRTPAGPGAPRSSGAPAAAAWDVARRRDRAPHACRAGRVGPPWRYRERSALLGQHHRAEDLVGKGLPARVEARVDVADQADPVQDVADVPHEGHQGSDRLPVRHADKPQVEGLLAPALPGLALHDPAVVDLEAEEEQVAESRQQPQRGRRVAVGGRQVERQDQEEDRDGLDEPVDEVGADALDPAAERPAHVEAWRVGGVPGLPVAGAARRRRVGGRRPVPWLRRLLVGRWLAVLGRLVVLRWPARAGLLGLVRSIPL